MIINNENKNKPEFYLFDTSLALCDNGKPSVNYFGEFLNNNMALINRKIQYGNVCALMVFSLGYVLSRDNSSYTSIENIKSGFENNHVVYELSNFLQQLIPSNSNNDNGKLFIKSFNDIKDYYKIPGSDYLINKNFYSINRFLNIGETINDNRFSNYFKVVYNIDYFVKKYQHSAKEEEIANILTLIKNKDTSINDDNIDNITNAWNENIFKDGKFKYIDAKSIDSNNSNGLNKVINISSSSKDGTRSKIDNSDSILKSSGKNNGLMGSDELTTLNNNNEIVVGWGQDLSLIPEIMDNNLNRYRRIIYTLGTRNNQNPDAGYHYVAAEVFTSNNRTLVVHRDSLTQQLNQEFIDYIREYIDHTAVIVNINNHDLRQNPNELNCGPIALQNLEDNNGIVDKTRKLMILMNSLDNIYLINNYTSIVDLAENKNNNFVSNNAMLISNNVNSPDVIEVVNDNLINNDNNINTETNNQNNKEIEIEDSNVTNKQKNDNNKQSFENVSKIISIN